MSQHIIQTKEIFPINKIQEGKLYNTSQDVTIGFDVRLPEVFNNSKEDYYNFSSELQMLLRDLKPGECFHSLNYYYEDPYQAKVETLNKLDDENERFFKGTPVPKSEHQFYFTIPIKDRIAGYTTTPFMGALKSFFTAPFKSKEDYGELNRKLESIKNRMKISPYLKSKPLSNEALQQALYRYWSLNYQNKKYNGEALQPIAAGDVLKIGDHYVYMIGIREGSHLYTSKKHVSADENVYLTNINLPNVSNIDLSMIYPVSIGLPFNHMVSTSIEMIEIEQTKDGIQQFGMNTLSAVGSNFAQNKSDAYREFQKTMADHDLKPCLVNFTLIITDTDYYRLQRHIDLAKVALEGINECQVEFLNDEALASFWACSPGNSKNQYNKFQNFLWQAVQYLPKEEHYHSDGKGYRMIDRYGAVRLIDLWNFPGCNNRNGVMGGPSGKGKSATLNHLITETINIGGHCTILDKGHSYRDTTAILQGKYYDSGNPEQFKFNIFIDKQDRNGFYKYDSLQINYVYSIVSFIWREGKIMVTPEQKNIIKRIIKSYYEYINQEKVFPLFSNFYDYIELYRKEHEEEYREYLDFTSLQLMLEPYAYGEKDHLLNSTENIDLTYVKMTAFDVGAVEEQEDYFNILCLLIVNLVVRKIERLPKNLPKSFIIDEALTFLKGDTGDFMGDAYATFRKKGAQIILAAQNLEYLKAASPIVQKLILSNIDWIIMTNHTGYEHLYPDIQNLLGFTDRGMDMLKSLQIKEDSREVLFSLGGKYKIFNMKFSPYALSVYDTRETEVPKKEALKERFYNIDTVIKQHLENNQKENSSL